MIKKNLLNKNFLLLSIFFLNIFFGNEKYLNLEEKLKSPYKIETIFGDYLVEYEVIDKLLKSFAVDRLKSINQGGPCLYFGLVNDFSRYDHSIGVMHLIKIFGGSLMEQIVGLLHDSSHTAFSHLAETIFENKNHDKGYQDKIHLIFLDKSGTYKILESYGVKIEDLDPDCGKYEILERSLPFMCADRIEYNLHTGIAFNLLNKEELNSILNSLKYENSTWYFSDKENAKKFALLSLYFTKEFWASDWNFVLYKFFAEGIKRALDLNAINLKLLNYGKDIDVIEKMLNFNDPYIEYIFDCCKNIKNVYKISDKNDFDFFVKNKFRGIDPLILEKDVLVHLTKIDKDFEISYENCKKHCNEGFYIKLLKPLYLK